MMQAYAIARILGLLLLTVWAQTSSAQTTGWLDNDPNAIWSRPPGFYQDGEYWYGILHTKPDVERVRLVGEFTNEEADAIDLTASSGGSRAPRWTLPALPPLETNTISSSPHRMDRTSECRIPPRGRSRTQAFRPARS